MRLFSLPNTAAFWWRSSTNDSIWLSIAAMAQGNSALASVHHDLSLKKQCGGELIVGNDGNRYG
jgi:hypothetical protein